MPKFIERIGGGDLLTNPYYNDKKWCSGRGYKWLGSYFQCTDWALLRSQEIAERRLTYFTDYKEDSSICDSMMFNRTGKPRAREWFDKCLWDKTTIGKEARVGDVIVYGSNWGKGEGHVRVIERIENGVAYCSGGNESYNGGAKFNIQVPLINGTSNGLIGYLHNPHITYEEEPKDKLKELVEKFIEEYKSL